MTNIKWTESTSSLDMDIDPLGQYTKQEAARYLGEPDIFVGRAMSEGDLKIYGKKYIPKKPSREERDSWRIEGSSLIELKERLAGVKKRSDLVSEYTDKDAVQNILFGSKASEFERYFVRIGGLVYVPNELVQEFRGKFDVVYIQYCAEKIDDRETLERSLREERDRELTIVDKSIDRLRAHMDSIRQFPLKEGPKAAYRLRVAVDKLMKSVDQTPKS